MAMLTVEKLSKHFGGLAAISDLSFQVDKGEIRGIIGPNGAGKTTLFNVISGFYRPTHGRVTYSGKVISGLKPSRIAAMGIVRTFQRTALFKDFSVLKNVSVARHLREKQGIFRSVFGGAEGRREEKNEEAMRIIDFVGLTKLRDELAFNLPHGYQRILGLAVALAPGPEFLMLDEPTTGMNSTETQRMIELIKKIQDERQITVLLVEHDMHVVMELCNKITVLNFGNKLSEGTPKEIQKDEQVIEAYLGGEEVMSLLGT